MQAYEVKRENFEKLVRKYLDYVKLYKLCNNGSTAGITPFDQFYWRFTYIVRYQDPERISPSGF